MKSDIYERRISATALADIVPHFIEPGDVAIGLAHDYYYTIPLGIAECYHKLGDYPAAETYYLAAASYQFLNTAIEAPYLWLRIASL